MVEELQLVQVYRLGEVFLWEAGSLWERKVCPLEELVWELGMNRK